MTTQNSNLNYPPSDPTQAQMPQTPAGQDPAPRFAPSSQGAQLQPAAQPQPSTAPPSQTTPPQAVQPQQPQAAPQRQAAPQPRVPVSRQAVSQAPQAQPQPQFQAQAQYRAQSPYQPSAVRTQAPYQAQPQPQTQTQAQPQTQAQAQAQQQTQPRPQYPAPQHAPQTRVQAAAQTQGPSSILKTFLAGFAGAALACLLLLGITGNLLPSNNQGGITLGSAEGSSFTVTGEDATLAEAVSSKTLPSVGCIYVYSDQTSYSMWGNVSSGEKLSSLGSGIVLSEDGYMLTNAHVIEGESRLQVSLNDNRYDAQVVGEDKSSDLAVIKLDNASGLTPMEIGSSSALQVGQWVMTVGAPYGMEQSVATGIISAVSRSSVSLQDTEGGAVYANLIQTDAAINPGNSGGALVDANGKLIGVNTLVASYSGSYSGVGFAIPVDYAIGIAKQIINGEEPSHAQLGVSLVSIDADTARRYSLPVDTGAYVASSGGGAAEAGIEEGDIITKVNGKDVTSATDVILEVRSHMPGDSIKVTLNRNGETKEFEVTLGSDADQ